MVLIASFLFSACVLGFLTFELFRSRCVRLRTIRLHHGAGNPGSGKNSLSILHLSDLHATASTKRRLNAVAALAEKEYDFVLISGDLIENDTGIEPVAEALGLLRARCGKFAVPGNHDYYHVESKNILDSVRLLFESTLREPDYTACARNDIGRLVKTLKRKGIQMLRNELVEGKTAEGVSWQLFGIDDSLTGNDNPEALYGMKDPSALRLVLMHSPRNLHSIRPLDPALILCGHTHGGQIRLPLLGALTTGSEASRKAPSGMVSLSGCRVHISSGVGAGKIFPWRFNAPAEITEIILTP